MERLVREVKRLVLTLLCAVLRLESAWNQVRNVQQVLSEPFDEWKVCADALNDLAFAVESLGLDDSKKEAVHQLMPIADLLAGQITGLRSKLVIECCRHITRIVKVTQRDFKELANALLMSLASSAKASSRAIRQPAADLFSFISQHVRYDLHAFGRYYVTSQHEKVRMLLLEQLEMILVYWNMEDLEPYFMDVVGVVQKGLQDPSQSVRKNCRGTFCMVSSKWPTRTEELIFITTPQTRDILVKEKPTAEIVKVMMTKFPELEKKKTKLAAPSTKTFVQQRSLLRRNPSSVSDQDDEVQIHLPIQSTQQNSKAVIETLPSKSLNELPDSYDHHTIKHQSGSALSTGKYGASSYAHVDPVMDEARSEVSSQPRNENIDLGVKSDHSTFIATPPRARPDEVFRRSRIELRSEGSKIPLPSDRSPNIRRSTEVSAVRTQESLGEFRSSIPKPRGRSLFSANSTNNSNIVTEKDKFDGSLGDSLDRPFRLSEDFSPSPSLPSNVTIREKRRPLPDPLPTTPVPPFSEFEEEPPTVTLQFPFFGADHSEQEINIAKMNDEVFLNRSDASEAVAKHAVINDEIDETMFIDRSVQSTSLGFLDRERPIATSPQITTEPSAEELLESVRQLQFQLNAAKNVSDQKEMGMPLKRRSVKKNEEMLSFEASNTDFAQRVRETAPKSTVPDSLNRSDSSNIFASLNHEEPREIVQVGKQNYGHEFESESMVTQEKEMQGRRSDFEAAVRTSHSKERQPYRYEFGGKGINSQPKDQQTSTEVKKFRSYRHEFGVEISTTQPEEDQAHQHLVTAANAGFHPKEEQRVHQQGFDIARASQATEDVYFTEPHNVHRGKHEERANPKDDSIFIGADFKVDRHMMRRRDDRLGIETTEGKLRVQTEECQRRGGQLFRQDEIIGSSLASKHPPNQPVRQRRVQSERVARHNQADENDFWEKAHQYASNEDRRLFSSEYVDDVDPVCSKTEQHGSSALFEEEHRDCGRHSNLFEAVPENLSSTERAQQAARDTRSNDQTASPPVPELSLKTTAWTKAMLFYFVISLGLIFGASGLLRAMTTIRDSHAYHHALLSRIGKFESSIAESYKAVRKLEDNYVVWSEYVRKLAQEDEASASLQLESIQREVEKWQVEMKEDLEEFKLSLAIDLADATFAPPQVNTTGKTE